MARAAFFFYLPTGQDEKAMPNSSEIYRHIEFGKGGIFLYCKCPRNTHSVSQKGANNADLHILPTVLLALLLCKPYL